MKISPMAKKACLILAAVSMTGCLSQRAAVTKNTFLVETRRSGQALQGDSQALLTVQPFSIAPEFQRHGIVSRVDEHEYAADFYNEYFVSPAAMVTHQTRQWLAESGLFGQVLSPSSMVQPTYVLEGDVRRLFLDVTDSEQPKAVLEITFYLVEKHKRDEAIVFRETYTAVRPLDRPEPQAYAAAQSEGLTEILRALEKDLAAQL
jgi:cholesterol transport system auxiliary component